MAVSFQPLFAIELLHGYFADGLCKVLTLAPTAETRRLMDRYRLLFRPSANGGTVSWSRHPDIDFLQLFNETIPFAFTLTCGDLEFTRYTELDAAAAMASPADTVFYFNNLDPASGPVAGRADLLLHPPGRAFAAGALPVRPAQSRLSFDPPARKASLKILDTLTGQAVRQFQTADGETRFFPLDLSGLDPGRYQLAINRKKPTAFYLSETPAVRCFGVVEIFAGGPAMGERVPAACRVIDPAGRPEPKTFAVRFDNRRTTWRYYVFAASGERSFEGYQVLGQSRRAANGNGAIRFLARPEPVDLEGRPARVFESEEPIALWQSPAEEHAFTLKPNGRVGGGASFPLPYAESSGTRLEGEGTARRMVSEIFVYL
jgi:hypothetical protein